ncbi:20672_t:CDS:2 [Entrophospora sp. SA101]|nr:20672_t:CDS:2 [Entrophospora sp. SA101]
MQPEPDREHLEVVKDNIQKHEDFPRTVNELKIALREEWENLDRSIFEEVVTSIPKRIDAVLRANDSTKEITSSSLYCLTWYIKTVIYRKNIFQARSSNVRIRMTMQQAVSINEGDDESLAQEILKTDKALGFFIKNKRQNNSMNENPVLSQC